jgi:hypothetical protein
MVGVFVEDTVSSGLLLFLAFFVPAVICGTGAQLCYEIIISDLRQRCPEGLGVKYPRMSWNYYKMIDLYKQCFPESRVPVVLRFLTFLGLGFMASLGLMGFVLVLFKPWFQ